MALGRVRPRFRMALSGTVEEHMARLGAAVAAPGSGCVSRVLGNHIDVTVVREVRHRWSPCLQLEFRTGDDGPFVDGLIGPHPNVWTLFAFVNFNIVVLAAFGLMLGLAQVTLERSPWGFWAVPVGLALLGGMYIASQAGRRFAEEQTRMLMQLVEDALGTTAGPNDAEKPVEEREDDRVEERTEARQEERR